MNVESLLWQIGISSDTGPVKKTNEDLAFFQISEIGHGESAAIAVVADGMGGYQAGDAASRMAVEMVQDWWEQRIQHQVQPHVFINKMAKELDERFHEINEQLLVVGRCEKINLGTTLSVLVLLNGQYSISHIGDSRIYKKSREVLTNPRLIGSTPEIDTQPLGHRQLLSQLTEDHSWVASQVELGKLSKEEARHHPKRNLLIQCLGIDRELAVFHTRGHYLPEDLFLLCSDGFYSLFSDERLDSMLSFTDSSQDLQEASNDFVYTANQSGATDNVTALLVRNQYTDPRSHYRTGFGRILDTLTLQRQGHKGIGRG